MVDPDFLLTVGLLALVTFGCRLAGYLMMRFVPPTPRVQSALRAVPLAVMIGIITPTALTGRVPELAGLLAVIGVMRLTRNELGAAVAGLVVVALGRYFGV